MGLILTYMVLNLHIPTWCGTSPKSIVLSSNQHPLTHSEGILISINHVTKTIGLQGTKWDQIFPQLKDMSNITNEKNSIWSKNCTGWKMGEGSDLQHHMNVFNQIISDLARL